ncbi:KWG Leptospira [compost metagenome]
MVISPAYDSTSGFLNGLAAVQINGKYGFIDYEGKEVIKPQYEYASFFHNDKAMVKLEGKWGFINRNNQFVVNPQYDGYSSILKGGFMEFYDYSPLMPYSQWMALLLKDGKKSYLLPDWSIIELAEEP